MQKTVIIFMSLEVGGKGKLAPEPRETCRTVNTPTVLEVKRRGAGASGLIIIRNA